MSALEKGSGVKPKREKEPANGGNKEYIDESLCDTFNMPVSGGWEWDLKTDKMIWSNRFIDIIERSSKGMKPTLEALLELVHQDDRNMVAQRVEKMRLKRGQFRVEFRILAESGAEKKVRLRGEALQCKEGHPEKAVGFIQEMTSQMVANEELRKSEQRHSFHTQRMPLGSIEWDVDLNVVEWNPAAERIFGYSREEALGKNAMDLIVPPSALPQVEVVWDELLTKSGGEKSVNENVTRDGGLIICEWNNTPLVDLEGEVSGVASLVQDVTERETARVSLKESEERYRLLVELCPVAIAAHCDGKIVYANPACVAMNGSKDQAALLGRPALDFVAPEYRAMVIERMRHMLEHGTRVPPTEQKFIREDGTLIDVEVVAAPFNYQGKSAVMVVFSDITHSKTAERELRKANDFLQNLMDTIPNPVFYKDSKGIYTGCNRAFEKFVGKSMDQIVGKSVHDMNPKDLADMYLAMDEKLIKSGGIQVYESQVKQNDDTYRTVISNKACYYEPDGSVGGIVGIILDITDLKLVERELLDAKEAAERASKAKTTFLSSISHEVRTPLNSIIGFANLLGSDNSAQLSHVQMDFVSRIQSSGENLLELFDEILDLSRIESGKMEVETVRVDLFEAALSALASVSDMASWAGVSLRGPDMVGELFVKGDLARLTQVLVNLLTNGIKFNKRGGKVAISYLKQEGGLVRITVEDTGAGVPPEKMDMLFEPFNRLGVEGLNVKGSGVGLTIVKKLVTMMGGKVEVDSSPGVGSRFHVTLTLAESDADIPLKDEKRGILTAAEAKSTVLIVEDNEDNLELMKLLLEKHTEYEVLSASQAPEALEIARTTRPSLILMDIGLPGMDGYEALRLLKGFKETKHIPVMAVSAHTLPQDIKKGLAAGFVRYLTKPVLTRTFIKEIGEVMESHGPKAES
ncbi:MAG: PAS domain S-box protein [Nitrospinota bacterium]|nr:PAS domain S-box protein [Nitrospinota bacterium]